MMPVPSTAPTYSAVACGAVKRPPVMGRTGARTVSVPVSVMRTLFRPTSPTAIGRNASPR
jgi:hypothetical protein